MKGYLVIDLEMCKVGEICRERFPYKSEIIQLGAVLLDAEYQIVKEFSAYVQPQYGTLDRFIENLTDIHNREIRGAGDLAEALKGLEDFCGGWDITTVSWSMSDYYQLKRETELKQIGSAFLEKMFSDWEDCQQLFSRVIDNSRRHKLEEALVIGQIETEGRAHDGLCDARNTALLFSRLQTEELQQFNGNYQDTKDEVVHLNYSLAGMLSGILSA